FRLSDMGSRNGTLLNGQPLTGTRFLHDADRIEICGIELTFSADAQGTDPSRAGTEEVPLVDESAPAPRNLAVLPVAPPSQTAPAGYTADKLRALTQMLKRLGSSIDVDETLRELLAGLFAIFPRAERGLVAFAEGPDKVTLRATHFRDAESEVPPGLSRTLVNQVLTRREAVLWTDQRRGEGNVGSVSMAALELHSAMCAPLLDGDGQPFGLVQIASSRVTDAFVADDLEVMSGAVSQAAVAVRFARLHEERLRRQSIERDLQLARQMQFSLLPAECPSWPDYQFFAYYQSAHEVGGDYYDFVELPNGRLAVVVADVAGKGVSAALLMAKLSGELKYHLSCGSPRAAVARMNESLCDSASGRFVTLLLAILERAAHRLTLINAGHLTPVVRRRSGAVEAVGAAQRGVALGILPGRQYAEVQAEVEPGDAWFVFTDGFTEAVNPGGELYGFGRINAQLAPPAGVPQLGERLVEEVHRFMGSHPQSDDMCLVGWGRLGAAVAPPALAPGGAAQVDPSAITAARPPRPKT
ncbi:MAG TPA: SpoIIE family protein phosphatase, partial [Gemmataceae bacterium]|nr:SpoIIE family protein phosphatase [Gemmataceae bacterium]